MSRYAWRLKSFQVWPVRSFAPRWSATFFAAFFSAVFSTAGLAFVVGGIWLAALGGSLYYALAGFALLSIAVLLFRRNAWVYWAYAMLILATLSWAVYEVGLDWWQLMPRGNFIVALGLVLAVPWIARLFEPADDPVFQSGYAA